MARPRSTGAEERCRIGRVIIDFRVQPPFASFLGIYFYRPRPEVVDPVKVNAFSIGRRTSASYVDRSVELLVGEMDEAGIDMSVIMGQHAWPTMITSCGKSSATRWMCSGIA